MVTCKYCGNEDATYDKETKIAHCSACGFNFFFSDMGELRMKSLLAIVNKKGSSEEVSKYYVELADKFIAEGNYIKGYENYVIANGIDAESVFALAGRARIICLLNPDKSIYQLMSIASGRAILECIELLATDDDFDVIESKYGIDVRLNRFDFWYNYLLEETEKFRVWEVVKKHHSNLAIRKHALNINFAMHRAARLANEEQIQLLKELCGGNDILIVDRIVYGHLGFITGATDAIIPEGVTYIYRDAFKHCHLNKVEFPSTLLEVDCFAFYNADIEELYLGTGSKFQTSMEIAENAFDKSKISNLTGNVKLIKTNAFR